MQDKKLYDAIMNDTTHLLPQARQPKVSPLEEQLSKLATTRADTKGVTVNGNPVKGIWVDDYAVNRVKITDTITGKESIIIDTFDVDGTEIDPNAGTYDGYNRNTVLVGMQASDKSTMLKPAATRYLDASVDSDGYWQYVSSGKRSCRAYSGNVKVWAANTPFKPTNGYGMYMDIWMGKIGFRLSQSGKDVVLFVYMYEKHDTIMFFDAYLYTINITYNMYYDKASRSYTIKLTAGRMDLNGMADVVNKEYTYATRETFNKLHVALYMTEPSGYETITTAFEFSAEGVKLTDGITGA